MVRLSLAVVALALCASTALAALDCSRIKGCQECTYVSKEKKGAVLMCTKCLAPGYMLHDKKGRCGE